MYIISRYFGKTRAFFTKGIHSMYASKVVQLSIEAFGEANGVKLSPDNRWVQAATLIPWPELEEAYKTVFPSNKGRAGKPFRLLFGAHLIKTREGLSDRELVDAIRDVPAYQFFMGLPEYQPRRPFVPSAMAHFRKRIAPIAELLENIIGDWTRKQLVGSVDDKVVILDATVTPVNIKYPQDYVLLGQARRNTEAMVTDLAHKLEVPIPRTYRREAERNYVHFTKHPKRTRKATHGMVKSQLQYLRRNLRYIHEFQDQGGQLTSKQTQRLEVIETLYEQQDYMYRNNTHSVERRIISLSQPFVRPIKRGKAKPRNGTEFGPKVDVSIIDGVVGIERFSFDNFNENQDFEDALYHYHDVHGEFPDMALVDKLYRTRENLRIAKNLGVKVCGPKLGRQPKYPDEASERKAKKEAREAENARGEIERNFALMKLKHGLGLVRAKTVETITTTVFTAMITANIDAVLRLFSLPFVLYVRYEGQILKIEYNDSI